MFVYAKTPTICVVDGVVTPEECQTIIEHSESKLQRSTVATPEGLKPDQDRTSHGVFLPHDNFSDVCARIADITGMPLERAEPVNVLRYTSEQEYKPHYDALEGEYLDNGGQRLLTCLIYLNNAVGGSTAFPRLNLIVGAIAGRLLMFSNVNENKEPHHLSLHQGLTPHEGEKWVMTLWFREKNIR